MKCAMNQIRYLSYKYSKKVNCSPKQIFDVVIDIKNYKNFIPFVTNSFHDLPYQINHSPSDVNNHSQQGNGTGGFEMNWNGYQEEINCQISYKVNQEIISRCETGIFKHLLVQWNFSPFKNNLTNKEQTNVELNLDYEFNNFLYNNLSSLVNQQLSKLMIKSFEKQVKIQNRDT